MARNSQKSLPPGYPRLSVLDPRLFEVVEGVDPIPLKVTAENLIMSPGALSKSQCSGDDASCGLPQEISNSHGFPKTSFPFCNYPALHPAGNNHGSLVEQTNMSDMGLKDRLTPFDLSLEVNGVFARPGDRDPCNFGRTFSGLNDTTTNHFNGEAFDFTVDNSDYPLWPLTGERAPDRGVTSMSYITKIPVAGFQVHDQTRDSPKRSSIRCHEMRAIENTSTLRRPIPRAAGRVSTVRGKPDVPGGNAKLPNVVSASKCPDFLDNEGITDNTPSVNDSLEHLSPCPSNALRRLIQWRHAKGIWCCTGCVWHRAPRQNILCEKCDDKRKGRKGNTTGVAHIETANKVPVGAELGEIWPLKASKSSKKADKSGSRILADGQKVIKGRVEKNKSQSKK